MKYNFIDKGTKDKVKQLLTRYGWRVIITLPLYPLFIFFINTISLIRTLYNYRNLKIEDAHYYSGNNLYGAFDNYVYYIQHINIIKFGRYGTSNLLAGGSYNLKKLFYLKPLSLKLYNYFGASFFLFLSMFIWISVIISIVPQWNMNNVMVILITLTSGIFFANYFDLQNYNALAWAIFPLIIKFLLNNSYFMLSITSLLISFISFTPIFFIIVLCLFISAIKSDIIFIFSIMPALIIFSLPVIKSFVGGMLNEMPSAIGFFRIAKYKYTPTFKLKFLIDLYVIINLMVLPLVYIARLGINPVALLLILSVMLLFINEMVARFADGFTCYIVYLSVATVLLLNSKIDLYILLSYFLSLNPIYGFICCYEPAGNLFFNSPIRKPINTKYAIESLADFLKGIPAKSKILLSFHNPNNNIWKVFDGFRVFTQPLQYVAIKKDIIVFPDIYFISKNNKAESPEDFWAVEPSEVERALVKYDAEYVLVYQRDKIIDSKWQRAGFNIASFLDWEKIINKIGIDYKNKNLYWWILKK